VAELAVSRTRPDLVRAGAAALLAMLGLILLWHAGGILAFGAWAIAYPHELDYGEGIVWQQMRMMSEGRGYGAIDGFPAIVFHYPPVYHTLSFTLASVTGIDELAAGRSVSLAALLASVACGGAIVHRLLRPTSGRGVASVGAAVAALVMLSNWPVLFWTPVMRVDFVALAFSFAGLWCGIAALDRPRMIHMAALAFVLAVYTKQNMIAAPAATFGALLLLRPRTALSGITTALLLGGTALAALTWLTAGGFVRHLFLYNMNRIDPDQLKPLATLFSAHALYLAVAVAGNLSWFRSLFGALRSGTLKAWLAAERGREGRLLLLAYLGAATLMLPLIAKSGSNANYLIEFICVVSLFVGLAMKDAAGIAFSASTGAPRLPALLLVAAIAAQALMLPVYRYDRMAPLPPAAERGELVALIRAADRPVVSDDMVAVLRAGKAVVWEPAIIAELASKGLVDEQAFIRRVERRDFAFFVTYGGPGIPEFDARYTPRVSEALLRHYPHSRLVAGLTVRKPAR
jgi:hypothetical protein